MKSKKICIGLIIFLIGISPIILFHIQIIEERKTKAYLYDVFHRCDSIVDWIASDCDIALDSTQKVEGLYSIKMTADNNQESTMRYDRVVDWSEFGDIIFWVYHPGWTNEIGWISLYTTDFGNYKTWEFDFAATWTKRTIDLSSVPLSSGGTLDLSNIDFIIIWQKNRTFPGEDYYFDFFHGRTVDITSDIIYSKITEELGVPSVAEFNIKGDTLDTFQAGLKMEIYDDDDVLSWTGRILYPETVLEGTEVVGKLKVIGSDSELNNVYRKNFTTVRDSDYILKNIIDNALPGFKYDDEIDNFTITYKYDLKTKIRKVHNYLSMLERGVIHHKPDGEIFFNKYNNLTPHPQHYQDSEGFEDEVVGTEGTAIAFIDSATLYDGELIIVSEWLGHKNILRLQGDVTGGENPTFSHNIAQATSGTHEFWFGDSDVTTYKYMRLFENATDIVLFRINGGGLYYRDRAGAYQLIQAIINDTIYHLKIVWRADNTFDAYVDEIKQVDNVQTRSVQTSGCNAFSCLISGNSTGYMYIDAYGETENASYTVGDNLNAWSQKTKNIKITSYTPAANRHVTKTPVIGANNDLGQVYYVGTATDAELQKFGIIELQPWRDPEITNYSEAKQVGDNLQIIYSLDTQMISMLVVGKKHIQVGYTVQLSWNILFNVALGNFLVTKRVWYPITDICELEITDNILTRKAFNLRVINKFYDEDAQEGYDHPDVPESTADGTVLLLKSLAELRAYVDTLTINQILMSGIDGFVKASGYGAAYTVAFSDVNAGVLSTIYVGIGGSFKVSIIHRSTANNFGKTAGGVIDISYDVAGGLETWNIGAQDFNLPLEDTRYLKIEQFGTAFTVANNSKVGILWIKDDNAGGATGTFTIYGMFLTRQ